MEFIQSSSAGSQCKTSRWYALKPGQREALNHQLSILGHVQKGTGRRCRGSHLDEDFFKRIYRRLEQAQRNCDVGDLSAAPVYAEQAAGPGIGDEADAQVAADTGFQSAVNLNRRDIAAPAKAPTIRWIGAGDLSLHGGAESTDGCSTVEIINHQSAEFAVLLGIQHNVAVAGDTQ